MNYSKPELSALGKAVHVIEHIATPKGSQNPPDGVPSKTLVPAYDLDE